MRFERIYGDWQEGRLTQSECALVLGVCERSFRRYCRRYEESEDGLAGLNDRRLEGVSHRKAPVDEVIRLTDLYGRHYRGWNVKHFYSHYRRHAEGQRSYSWVKSTLQHSGLVKKLPKAGTHRTRRERAGLPGMLLHQDGSTHECEGSAVGFDCHDG